ANGSIASTWNSITRAAAGGARLASTAATDAAATATVRRVMFSLPKRPAGVRSSVPDPGARPTAIMGEAPPPGNPKYRPDRDGQLSMVGRARSHGAGRGAA